MNDETKLTCSGVANSIIKLVKQEYPIGQHFQKKGSETIYKVKDLNPCGVILELRDPKTGDLKWSTVPYNAFFTEMEDLTKVLVTQIYVDETKNPLCWKKKVDDARKIGHKFATETAECSGLDLYKDDERLTVLNMTLKFMNEIYLPKNFPQAMCILVRKAEKVVSYDHPEKVVDTDEGIGLAFVRKDEWAVPAEPPKPKALVNKHDLTKIKKAITKKSSDRKISDFKVGDKFVFSCGKYQFIAGETVTVIKRDKKGGHVELKSSSDTQTTPLGVWMDDEVRVAIQKGILIRKNNILTKKLRDAKSIEQKTKILEEAAEKIRG